MLRIMPIFQADAGTETAERIFNKVIATYNIASTTPFYEQRLDLRQQARDLSRSEEAGLENMRAGIASVNLAQHLERLGKSRKENARTLNLADLGPLSLRAIFNEIKAESQAYVPAAAALSITYYQQQITQWESSIHTVREDLKLTESFNRAIQDVYPAIEKHWKSLTAYLLHGPDTFDKFYNSLRTTFGFSSQLGSETSDVEQKLYDEFHAVFFATKDNFKGKLKAWWEKWWDSKLVSTDPVFDLIQKKCQKRFITQTIEQFQQAENEYNKSPSVSKKIILRQRAAKLIAVMTQADDRYGVGLRHGIPEDWLNGHQKEELLQRAKQAIKLADNLALTDTRCAELHAAYKAQVVGPTWEQRQEQEKIFYQQYLDAYKAAAKKIAYRQADLREAGLELEFVCQLLSKPYQHEIQYYRSHLEVKKHQEKHKKLVDDALNYFLAATSKDKLSAKWRFKILLGLYQQNYQTYVNAKWTGRVRRSLEEVGTVNIVHEEPLKELQTGQVVTTLLTEKSIKIPATREMLFNINHEWSRVIGSIAPQVDTTYGSVMGADLIDIFKKDLILTKYLRFAIDKYMAKLKEYDDALIADSKLRNEFQESVAVLLYRADFCSRFYPQWYADNQTSIQIARKKFPKLSFINNYGLNEEVLREEKKIQRDFLDKFALIKQKMAEFRGEKGKHSALSGEDVQSSAASLMIAREALQIIQKAEVNQQADVETKKEELDRETQALIHIMLEKISSMNDPVDPLSEIAEQLHKCMSYTERDGVIRHSYPKPKAGFHDDLMRVNASTTFEELGGIARLNDISLPNNPLQTYVYFILKYGAESQCHQLENYFQFKKGKIPLVFINQGRFFAPIMENVDWGVLPTEGQARSELIEVMQKLSALFVTMNLLAEKAEQMAVKVKNKAFDFSAEDITKIIALQDAGTQLELLQKEAESILDGIQERTNLASYFSANRDLVMALKDQLRSTIPASVNHAKLEWQKVANSLAESLLSTLFSRNEQGDLATVITSEQFFLAKQFIEQHAYRDVAASFTTNTDFMAFVREELIDKAIYYQNYTDENIDLAKASNLLKFCEPFVDNEQQRALQTLFQLLENPYILTDEDDIRNNLLPLFPKKSEEELSAFLFSINENYPYFLKGLIHHDAKDNKVIEKILPNDKYREAIEQDHKRASEIKVLLTEFLQEPPHLNARLTLTAQVDGKPVTSYNEVVKYARWLAYYGDEHAKRIYNELKPQVIEFAKKYDGNSQQTYHALFAFIHHMGIDFSDTTPPPLLSIALKRLQYLYENKPDALASDPAIYLQSLEYSGSEEQRKAQRDSDLHLIQSQEKNETFVNMMREYLKQQAHADDFDELQNHIHNNNQRDLYIALVSTYDTDARRAHLLATQIDQLLKQENDSSTAVKKARKMLDQAQQFDDEEKFGQLIEAKLLHYLSQADKEETSEALYQLCMTWGTNECRKAALIGWLDKNLAVKKSEELSRLITTFGEENRFFDDYLPKLQSWLTAQLKKIPIKAETQQKLDSLVLEFGNDQQKSELIIRRNETAITLAVNAHINSSDLLNDIDNQYREVCDQADSDCQILNAIQDWFQSKLAHNSDELSPEGQTFTHFYQLVLHYGTDEQILAVLKVQLNYLESQQKQKEFQQEITLATGKADDKHAFVSKINYWLKENRKKVEEFDHLCYLIQYANLEQIVDYIKTKKDQLQKAIKDSPKNKEQLKSLLTERPDLELRTYRGVESSGWRPFSQKVYFLLGMEAHRKDEFTNWLTFTLEHPESIIDCEKKERELTSDNSEEFNRELAPIKDHFDVNKKYGDSNANHIFKSTKSFVSLFDITASFNFISVLEQGAQHFVKNVVSFATKLADFIFGKKPEVVSSKTKTAAVATGASNRSLQRFKQNVELVSHLNENSLDAAKVLLTRRMDKHKESNKELLAHYQLNNHRVLVVESAASKVRNVAAEERTMLLEDQRQVAEHVRIKCFAAKVADVEALQSLVEAGVPALIFDSDSEMGKSNPLYLDLLQLLHDRDRLYGIYQSLDTTVSNLTKIVDVKYLSESHTWELLSNYDIEKLEAMYLHLDTASKFTLYTKLKGLIARIPENAQPVMKQRLELMANMVDPNLPIAGRDLSHDYIAKYCHAYRKLDVMFSLNIFIHEKGEVAERLKKFLDYHHIVAGLSEADRLASFAKLLAKGKDRLIEDKPTFTPFIDHLFEVDGIQIIEVLDKIGLTSFSQSQRCKDVSAANQCARELIKLLNNDDQWKYNSAQQQMRALMDSLANVDKFADQSHRQLLRKAIEQRFKQVFILMQDYNQRIKDKNPISKTSDIALASMPLRFLQRLYTDVYKPHQDTNEQDGIQTDYQRVNMDTVSAVRIKLNTKDTWLKKDGVITNNELAEKFFASALHFVKVFGTEADKREVHARVIDLPYLSYLKQASNLGVKGGNLNALMSSTDAYFARQENLGKYLDEDEKPLQGKFRSARISASQQFIDEATRAWVSLPVLAEMQSEFIKWRDKFNYTVLTLAQYGMDERVSKDEVAYLRNELVHHGTSSINKAIDKLSPRAHAINNALCRDNYPVRILVKKSARHVNAIRKLRDPDNQTPEQYKKTLKEVAEYLEKHQQLLLLLTKIGKLEQFYRTLESVEAPELKVFASLLSNMRSQITELKKAVAMIKPNKGLDKQQQQQDLRKQISDVDSKVTAAVNKTKNAFEQDELFQLWDNQYQPGEMNELSIANKLFHQAQQVLKKEWDDIESKIISPEKYLVQIKEQLAVAANYNDFINKHADLKTEPLKTFSYKAHVALTIEGATDPAKAVKTLAKIDSAVIKESDLPASMKHLAEKEVTIKTLEESVGFSREFYAVLKSLIEKIVNGTINTTELEKLPPLIKSDRIAYLIVSDEQKRQLSELVSANKSKLQTAQAKELLELANKAMTCSDLMRVNQEAISKNIIKKEHIVELNNAIERSRASERVTSALDKFLASPSKNEFEQFTSQTLVALGEMTVEQKHKLDLVIAKLNGKQTPVMTAAAIKNLQEAVQLIASDKVDKLNDSLQSLAEHDAAMIEAKFKELNNPAAPASLDTYLKYVGDLTQNKGVFAGQYYVVAHYGSEQDKQKIADIVAAVASPYLRVVTEIIKKPEQTLGSLVRMANRKLPVSSEVNEVRLRKYQPSENQLFDFEEDLSQSEDNMPMLSAAEAALQNSGKIKVTYEMLGFNSDQNSDSITELGLTLASMRDKLLAFNRMPRQLFAETREENSKNDTERLIELETLLADDDIEKQLSKAQLVKMHHTIIDLMINADSFIRLRLAEILLDYLASTHDIREQLHRVRSHREAVNLIKELNQIIEDRKPVQQMIKEFFPEKSDLQLFYFDACLEPQRVTRTHQEGYQPITPELLQLFTDMAKKPEKLTGIEQQLREMKQTDHLKSELSGNLTVDTQKFLAELEKKKSDYENLKNQYHEKLEQLDKDIKDCDSKITDYNSDVESLKEQLQKADTLFKSDLVNAGDKKNEIETLCGQIESNMQNMREITAAIDRTQRARAQLNQKIILHDYERLADLSPDIKGKFEQLQKHKAEFTGANKALIAMKDKQSRLVQQKVNMADGLKELEKKIDKVIATTIKLQICQSEVTKSNNLEVTYNATYKETLINHSKRLVTEIAEYYQDNSRADVIELEAKLNNIVVAFANFLHQEINKFKQQSENAEFIKGYDLVLMSSLPKKDKEQAVKGTVYLSGDGTFVLRDLEGKVQTGKIDTKSIPMDDLENKLNEKEFKSAILEVISKAGHTLIKKIEEIIDLDIQDRLNLARSNYEEVNALNMERDARINYRIADHLGLYDNFGYSLLGALLNAVGTVKAAAMAENRTNLERSSVIAIPQEHGLLHEEMAAEDIPIAETFKKRLRYLEKPSDVVVDKKPSVYVVGSYLPPELEFEGKKLAVDKGIWAARLDGSLPEQVPELVSDDEIRYVARVR